MNTKEMLKTLNEKQKHYVNLNLKNPQNGEYLLCVFHFVPGDGLNVLQAATEIAAESSTL
jgi:ribulose-bisphosphate carboxylase large chain